MLTNNHVIKDAERAIVTLKDRRQFTAKLVGTDPGTDIAVLQIEAAGLSALKIGDSDHLQVGDYVLAIGNPVRHRPDRDLGHRQRARPQRAQRRRL